MSAHIGHQPSLNAQWQKPHCEDPTLSFDRAARWTVQQQGGIWYQCQQSDLTLYVCIWKGECTVPKDCREHMCWWRPERVLKWRLMNERPKWAHVSGRNWRVNGTSVIGRANLSFCLRNVLVCVVKCRCTAPFRFVTWCPTECRLTKFYIVQHNVMNLNLLHEWRMAWEVAYWLISHGFPSCFAFLPRQGQKQELSPG